MRIIGFNFTKISAERKKNIKGKLEVKSNLEIENIKKEKIDVVESNVLKFDFKFIVSYDPGFAELVFNGFVLIMLEKERIKDIMKNWKKKKINDKIKLPLFNLILTKCNIKSLQFEEEFGLPTHVPMPRLTSQQQNPGTGTSSRSAGYV